MRWRARAYVIQYGIGVPKGEVARSAAEAEKIAKEVGMSVERTMETSCTGDAEYTRW